MAGKKEQSKKAGLFLRLWYYLKFVFIGIKWNLIELFTFHKKFNLQKVPRRPEEVAVITGGARGIGFEVIKKLLNLHMHVVIGCRNESSGQEAIDKIRKSGISTGSTHVISLDLTSLDSVRIFANKVLGKYSKIHILLNNAGIMAAPYKITKDNLESQFQVNYLSHFLLTNMLLHRLIKAGRQGKSSRIINVSSAAHYGGIINFEDLDMQKAFSSSMAYMSSKLMQVISTRFLDNRLKINGAHVKVYAVHPGVVKTDLYEHIALARIFSFFFKLIYKTPEQGADGVTFAAISSKFEDEGGLYFANCKKNSVNNLAKDRSVQQKLWDISCELTGWVENKKNSPDKSKTESILVTEENKNPIQRQEQVVKDSEITERTLKKDFPMILPKILISPTSSVKSYSSNSSLDNETDEEQPEGVIVEGPRQSISSSSSSSTIVEPENKSETIEKEMTQESLIDVATEIVETAFEEALSSQYTLMNEHIYIDSTEGVNTSTITTTLLEDTSIEIEHHSTLFLISEHRDSISEYIIIDTEKSLPVNSSPIVSIPEVTSTTVTHDYQEVQNNNYSSSQSSDTNSFSHNNDSSSSYSNSNDTSVSSYDYGGATD